MGKPGQAAFPGNHRIPVASGIVRQLLSETVHGALGKPPYTSGNTK